jgi:hypothetical protein
MLRRALFPLVTALATGALGPVLHAPTARAAPPPAFDLTLLPVSTLVLRAAADASGVYACTLDSDGETRWLVRRTADGAIDRLVRSPRIERIALDDERVYWVGDAGVQAVPKAGGDVETLAGRDANLVAGSPDPSPWALAVDADDVYFSIDGGLGRVPKRGGEAQLLAGGERATLVGVDAAEVFWLEADRDVRSWSLVATPKRGGSSRRIEAGLPDVLAAVLEDDAVAWLGATERPGVGALHRTAKDTGDDAVVARDVPTYYPHVLAAAGGALLWLDYPHGLHGPMRVRGERGSAAPVTLAEAFPPANEILVDDRYVYWAQEGLRAIARPAP